MFKLQISSGFGPDECRLGVERFVNYLLSNYKCNLYAIDESTRIGFNYAIVESDDEETIEVLKSFIGPIRWNCHSPIVHNEKYHNWYFNCYEFDCEGIDESKLVFDLFPANELNCKKNKTEYAVKVTEPESGAYASCRTEHSTFENKKMAIKRLRGRIFKGLLEHVSRSQRPRPVAEFSGLTFKLVEPK